MTVIRNIGLFMVPPNVPGHEERGDTAMIPKELFLAMGFPVSDSAVQAAHGTRCIFHASHKGPKVRTRRSMSNQCGNAMHVSTMGIMHLICFLKMPSLGSRRVRTAIPAAAALAPKRKRDA
eukprot:3116052-Karenia_brevis.AAC.1